MGCSCKPGTALAIWLVNVLGGILLLAGVQAAHAWGLHKIKERPLPDRAGSYLHYRLTKPENFPVNVEIVRLEPGHYRPAIVAQKRDNRRLLMNLTVVRDALVGINGGYYREQFLPNGLLVTHARTRSAMVHNNLLSAVVAIDHNQLVLMRREQYQGGVQAAFQTGPVLYESGQWAGFSSDKQTTRSGIMRLKDGSIVLVYINAATMNGMVSMLEHILEARGWQPDFVVNLDGGRAASLIVNFARDPVIHLEDQYIKTAILFSVLPDPQDQR